MVPKGSCRCMATPILYRSLWVLKGVIELSQTVYVVFLLCQLYVCSSSFGVVVCAGQNELWLWWCFLSCAVLQNNGFRSQSAMRAADRTRQPRRYYYERSRAQIAARQARSQAKQRFTELARMRNNPQNPVLTEKDDIKRVGSRLIVLMDYPAPQDDELSLEFGEAVFADVLKQAGADRIWAYCPRSDKCGFIPVSLVVPPAV